MQPTPPGSTPRASAAPRTRISTQILALAPDLVVANEEENREPDLAALRDAGVDVLVTEVRTLPQAFGELDRVLVEGCGLAPGRAGWTRPRRRGRGAPPGPP